MTSLVFVALLLAANLANASQPPQGPVSHGAHPPPAHHSSHDHAPVPGVRWRADAPLARGMQRVRAATQALSHGAHGRLDSAQVRAIVGELDAAVQGMFAQCRLASEPDAALHPLLARVVMAGARLADGRFDAQALAELEAVLARYPLLFEDAAWSLRSDASGASTMPGNAGRSTRSRCVSAERAGSRSRLASATCSH